MIDPSNLLGGYWHVVLNMDLTVAVTQNFCSSVNFPTVWTRVLRSRPKMSKKFLERLKRRRPDLARLTERIDVNADTGPRSDSSSSSSSSSSADSSPDSAEESENESNSTGVINGDQHPRPLDQGDEPLVKKQRVSTLPSIWCFVNLSMFVRVCVSFFSSNLNEKRNKKTMCASISVTNALLSFAQSLSVSRFFCVHWEYSSYIGTMSELVSDTKIKIDDPRYDQNTYTGRGKFKTIDRRTLHHASR